MNTCIIFRSKRKWIWMKRRRRSRTSLTQHWNFVVYNKSTCCSRWHISEKREQIVRILFLSLWLSTTSFTLFHCYPSCSLPYDIPTCWNFPSFFALSFLLSKLTHHCIRYTLHNKQFISKCVSMCFLTFAYSQFLIVMSASSAHQKKRWRIETYGTTHTKRAETKQ